MVLMLLSACASNIPAEIRQDLDHAPSIAQLRAAPDSYVGEQVRWGGVIEKLDNREQTSRLTIIAFPLSDQGEPLTSQPSSGRFIAVVNEFLEPLVYTRNRHITVRGSYNSTETQNIGEFLYAYPLISTEHHYLWPKRQIARYNPYPPFWYHDPWLFRDHRWNNPPRSIIRFNTTVTN